MNTNKILAIMYLNLYKAKLSSFLMLVYKSILHSIVHSLSVSLSVFGKI